MALYVYKKAPVTYTSPPEISTPAVLPASPLATATPWTSSLNKLKHLAPTILITLGSLLIANVVWPILHYQIFISPTLQKAQLITPININQTAFIAPAAASNQEPASPLTNQALSQEIDYTKASNWFPGLSFADEHVSKITHYTLTIPKIKIDNATVQIGGEDLSDHLIQYPGTANPGQLGSPVIFGHSVLRQFYNPTSDNPHRYISIFSKIMTLNTGDDIFIDFDGIRYKYVVKDKLEIKPEDIFILQQRYNNRELKLITCVPEGTYLRRGVVVAQLEDYNHPL